MAATLIVDASFCSRTGAAGWACWVIRDGCEYHMQGGVIACVQVRDNHEAELVAVLHGLNVAAKYAPGHEVLLQSDSMRALSLVRERFGWPDRPARNGRRVCEGCAPNPVERRVLDAMGVLLLRYPLACSVRHVKGHKRRARGRHHVNRLCDELARRYMAEARAGAAAAATEALVVRVCPTRRMPLSVLTESGGGAQVVRLQGDAT